MDKIDSKYFWDALTIIGILVVTLVAYIEYPNPSVLFVGSLGLTFFVAANIVMFS